VTKSDQKPVSTPKNNIDADDEKSHFMSQLMKEKAERSNEIAGLMDALRKIGYFQSFQTKDNCTFSGEKGEKKRSRKLKSRHKAKYRRVKKYYKSVDQYKKERLRRKLCWLLSGTITYEQIGEMLGISKRTVIRDINKIRPYYERMFRSYARKLQADRFREVQAKLATMSLSEKFDCLTNLIIEQRERMKLRDYKSHFTIWTLDMTQADKYGIPKLSVTQKGKTLAFPHKMRIHVIASYEGKKFCVDIGGTTLTQTRGGW